MQKRIFHARQHAAQLDLHFTADARIGLIRALKMTVLFMWLLLDMLESEIGSEINEAKALRQESNSEGFGK